MTRRAAPAVPTALIVLLAGAGAAPVAAQRIDDADSTTTPARFADAWYGEDKVRHLGASAAITALGYGGSRVVLDHDGSIGAALAAAALAGLLREIHDGRDGRFSYKDLVWDAMGVAAGYFWIREIE